MNTPQRTRVALALLVVAVIAMFGPQALTAGWVIDDVFLLARHDHHGAVLGEWRSPTFAYASGEGGHVWHPLNASLQHVLAIVFGRSPSVFRWWNAALHLSSTLLVFAIARQWGARAEAAAMLAALFAFHPAAADVVCWPTEHAALPTVFALAAVWGALRWPVALAIGWAVACFGLAVFSKESVLGVAPGLWLLLVGRGGRRAAIPAALGLGGVAAGFLFAHGAVTGGGEGYVSTAAGAAGAAVVAYLELLATVFAPPWGRAPLLHLTDDASPLLAGGGLVIGLGLAVWAWRTREVEQRGPAAAALLLGSLAVYAVGAHTVGLLPVRYTYMPVALAAGTVGASMAVRLQAAPRLGALVWVSFLMAMLAHSAPRVPAWQRQLTLQVDELRFEPDNPVARAQLARVLARRGDARLLDAWAAALDDPRARRVTTFRPTEERFNLAQAAFLSGRPALALDQVVRFIGEREAAGHGAPPLAWCLQADALAALGRGAEAEAAGRSCRVPPPKDP